MEIDRKELEKKDGKEGRPVYVSVDGKVVDVSKSEMWKGGIHMDRHKAGRDLTESISRAPHGKEILERFPQVGRLKEEAVREEGAEDEEAREEAANVYPLIPDFLGRFLDARPFFKRHPHPMTVHFPTAYFIAAALFAFWNLLAPSAVRGEIVFYMNLLGFLSLFLAMSTGFLSWMVIYRGKLMGKIVFKLVLALILLALSAYVFITMIRYPDVLDSPIGMHVIVPFVILFYVPLVILLGYLGGQLVFPKPKK